MTRKQALMVIALLVVATGITVAVSTSMHSMNQGQPGSPDATAVPQQEANRPPQLGEQGAAPTPTPPPQLPGASY